LSSHLQQQLHELARPERRTLLTQIQRGIEKESLRITPEGRLAQTPHSPKLGSALTHSSITTDYSEALLEFITPPSTSIEQSLATLEDIHSFVYQNLDNEMLWAASMPCIMTGDEGIPVAQYGSANVARMKNVYRLGLGHRYGRLMQTIAGIHYNFSMPMPYWKQAWSDAGEPGKLKDYISERYLGLIRNFHRYSWLLIYLFGASPAVCASFLRGQDGHELKPFEGDPRSLHLPYGTALRMGDLGYNSDAQKDLNVCYNNLDNYVSTLSEAIRTPHSQYADIPCGRDGEYQQLNDSLLQIENEFYSPIRPKRVAFSGETPLGALRRGGIEYIEVRCVDVSPFTPVGLDAQQIRFMDTFLLYCLLEESPDCNDEQQAIEGANLEAVVNRGRQPGLCLNNAGQEIALKDWAAQLLGEMDSIATLLDEEFEGDAYRTAVSEQSAKVRDPELTPSALVLQEMREKQLPFFRLAMEYSDKWADHFKSRELSPQQRERFSQESQRSLQAQAEIEQSDDQSFAQYLDSFFAQYQQL
jgi:glutamate--cysteine ligase